ncbi:MAG: homoserine dehydrogenase [Oscillospiraceae bacterium]
MNVALLGFGTVGKGFYELVQGRSDLKVTAVLSRRPRPELSCLVSADIGEILASGADLVIEVMGGLHPAYEYVCAALAQGKHVVTANKQLMCEYYEELTALAAAKGAALRCTAAAGGGIPWLTSLERAAAMDTVYKVEGILNGTTNFMLDAMTKNGTDYGEILAEAQRLGYAEADPTADVEGLDARRKIVLSANIAFGVSLREEEIPCFGIATVSAADIRAFTENGLVCKLIASAERSESGITACVEPTLFTADAAEAAVAGSGNLVSLYAEKIGKQSFSGAGAGGWPTGSNVLGDCLQILDGCRRFYTDKFVPAKAAGDARRRYYVRSKEELPAAVERSMGPGFITAPMAAAEAHQMIRALREKDGGAFMAALR